LAQPELQQLPKWGTPTGSTAAQSVPTADEPQLVGAHAALATQAWPVAQLAPLEKQFGVHAPLAHVAPVGQIAPQRPQFSASESALGMQAPLQQNPSA
jgi:hypothetical protein